MATTKRNKGLGRGLEALLGPKVSGKAGIDLTSDDSSTSATDGQPSTLQLTQLVPGVYQPRTRMDEGALYELAESIRSQGIMQPILVRPLGSGEHAGKYEIIAGERRFRAAGLAGLESVPVLVRDVADEAAAVMALIENMQREDLNPLEEAQGLQRLVQEFGLTHEQAAQAVGRSRSAASNLLRLLQQIASRKLSVREAEKLVKKLGEEFELKPQRVRREKSGDVRTVEEELSDLLAAEVEVRVKKRVKRNGRIEEVGELAIQFGSLEALNGLIDRLRG